MKIWGKVFFGSRKEETELHTPLPLTTPNIFCSKQGQADIN